MSRQRSLDQERAKAAWKAVFDYKNANMNDVDKQAKFRTIALSGPSDIQMNGLGQTLAFWHAKARKEPHHDDLFRAVSGWVKGQIQWQEGDDVLDWVVNHAQTPDYRRATTEALAFLKWVKRFAEAELEERP